MNSPRLTYSYSTILSHNEDKRKWNGFAFSERMIGETDTRINRTSEVSDPVVDEGENTAFANIGTSDCDAI